MEDADHHPDDHAAELLGSFQETGDAATLDLLLRLEIAKLKTRIQRRYGSLLTPTRGASDVAQDVAAGWIQVARRTSFENPTALRGYLLRAAFRLLIRNARRHAARPTMVGVDDEGTDPESPALGPIAAAIANADRTAFQLALATLPQDQRLLLERVYLGQIDIKVAADELGIAHDAAYKRAQRGRVALAGRLAAWSRVLD